MASHKTHVIDTKPATTAVTSAANAFLRAFPALPAKGEKGRVNIGGGVTLKYDSVTAGKHTSIMKAFRAIQKKIVELGLDVRFEDTKKATSPKKKKGGRQGLV